MKGTVFVNITTADGELLDRFRVDAIGEKRFDLQGPIYHLEVFNAEDEGDDYDMEDVSRQIRIRARQQLSKVLGPKSGC